LTKALLLQLVTRFPDCVPLDEVMPEVARHVAASGGGDMASQVSECLSEFFSLFAHRAVTARPLPLRLAIREDAKPRASSLAREQSRSGAQRIATIHHGNLDLDTFAARLLSYLDGQHTREQAAARLVQDLKTGDLSPPEGVQPRQWSEEHLHRRTLAAVDNLLRLFARYGVLETLLKED
jgi:hypothetical protein